MRTLLFDRNMLLGDQLFPRLGKAKAVEGRSLTAKDLKKTDLLFVRSTCKLTRALLEGSPVRFIGSGVAGTDHIDFDALREQAITLATAPGCNAESVANFVVAALLSIGERQHRSWEGATLGIIGVGHVGSIVKRFAEEALGMKTLCCDPPRVDDGDFLARDFVPYEEVLAQADVLTFHTPLIKEGKYKTLGLFSGPIVRKVKPGAVLLNFARGPICDNALLTTMLNAGLLSNAAIDCWEGEPDYSADLAALACLTTPHIAGHAYEGKADGTVQVYREACNFLEVDPGKIPAYPPAPVSELTIDCADKTAEEVLRIAVKATCDIEGDTRRFRAAYSDDPEVRRANFDALRKDYPLRRHFSATTLYLSNATPTLEQRLAALGFIVKPAQAKKATAKKAVAKKAVAKKTTKKLVAKKAAPKKATTKKTVAKKATAKKPVAKKTTAKKVTSKKAPVKKAAKKPTTTRKRV